MGSAVGVLLHRQRRQADGRGPDREDAPSTRTIDRIKAAITSNLPRCRTEWWARVGTCCVDNRWIRVSRTGR